MTISAGEVVQGGKCSCGALYLVDQTGKNVGLVMAQALGLVADDLQRKMIDLVPEQDYDDAVMSYDWKTHRSFGPISGYMDGYGRLYVIKAKRTGS